MSLLGKKPADTSMEEMGSQKRSCLEEESSEEDEEDIEHIIDQREVEWKTDRGMYTVTLKLEKNYENDDIQEVRGSLFFDKKAIGELSGTILPRPYRGSFYSLADEISGELLWIANLFCDENGSVTCLSTNLEGSHVYRGGFFHIDSVMVEVSHKGQDLGLRLLHETLGFLHGRWNLAVLNAGPLTSSFQSRLGIKPMTTSYDSNGKRLEQPNELRLERVEKIRNATLKICRHWGRMGFQQAGRNADEYEAWYLTAPAYFGNQDMHIASQEQEGSETSQSMAHVMNQWKSREEIQALDVFIPEPKHEPLGADKKLNAIIEKIRFHRGPIDPAKIESVSRDVEKLIANENASIHGSRVLFILAANVSANTALLRAMINLATLDDIDASDENGNRPLHVAATFSNEAAIRYLVEAGASRTAKNQKGNTPLEILQKEKQSSMTSVLQIPLTKPIDVEPFLHSVHHLMDASQREQLVDDWLPPRMMAMLRMTACVTTDFDGIQLEESRPASLKLCYDDFDGIGRMEYIPYEEMSRRNPKGLYKPFQDGWGMVWEAMYSLLDKKQAPTLSRVEQEIRTMNTGDSLRRWSHFLDKGGKAVYAIDALLKITSNVQVNGEDGWFYEHFEDEMERLPSSPLDGAFDVARLKCLEINNNNFLTQPSGPYASPYSY